MSRALPLLAGHEWHQSCVGLMLRCPRAFRLKYVDRISPDFAGTGFAAPRGTAQHTGAELGLRAANAGEAPPDAATLLDAMLESFEAAVHRAHGDGATWEPDAVEAAMAKLESEDLPRIVKFVADPRLRAVRWEGIELGFELETKHRRWKGTLDAYGVATAYFPRFGKLGADWVDLYPGDRLLADWKSGVATQLGRIARTIQPQLTTYAMALAAMPNSPHPRGAPLRCFIGNLRDLDTTSAPADEHGKRIPKKLPKELNPAFFDAIVASLDVDPMSPKGSLDAAARASKRKPRGGDGKSIPKWLPERENPAYTAAAAAPKGPLFRECEVNFALSSETVFAAIRAAEAGLFPATGANSGACSFCDFRRDCAPRLEID